MAGTGARFAHLLDAAAMEARRWNNDGHTEDVATCGGVSPEGDVHVKSA